MTHFSNRFCNLLVIFLSAAAFSAHGISPDSMMRCNSSDPEGVQLDLDIYSQLGHPMAGLQVFGVMKIANESNLSFPIQLFPVSVSMTSESLTALGYGTEIHVVSYNLKIERRNIFNRTTSSDAILTIARAQHLAHEEISIFRLTCKIH